MSDEINTRSQTFDLWFFIQEFVDQNDILIFGRIMCALKWENYIYDTQKVIAELFYNAVKTKRYGIVDTILQKIPEIASGAGGSYYSPLFITCLHEDVKMTELLFTHGSDPTAYCGLLDKYAIDVCFDNNNLNLIRLFINTSNKSNEIIFNHNIILNVVRKNNIELLEFLVNHNINICPDRDWKEEYNNNNTTVLFQAVLQGEIEVLDLVLKFNNADINKRCEMCGTQMLSCLDMCFSSNSFSEMNHVNHVNQVEIFKLLVRYGATDPDLTSLRKIIKFGGNENLNILKIYFDSFPDTEITDSSFLMMSTKIQITRQILRNIKPDVINLICRNKDNQNYIFNNNDYLYSTCCKPFEWACQNNLTNIAVLFIECGSNVECGCNVELCNQDFNTEQARIEALQIIGHNHKIALGFERLNTQIPDVLVRIICDFIVPLNVWNLM